MNAWRSWLHGAGLAIAASFAVLPVRAELLFDEKALGGDPFYAHPALRSLVFVSPEARGQAILPPAPYFLAPPPLIWRAPGTSWLYPPSVSPGFNRPSAPNQRDLAAYHIARAHAMSQGLYKRNDETAFWFGPAGPTGAYLDAYGWYASPWLYPPANPATGRPSNADNARYLIERAHRFSQDAYRKP